MDATNYRTPQQWVKSDYRNINDTIGVAICRLVRLTRDMVDGTKLKKATVVGKVGIQRGGRDYRSRSVPMCNW